MTRILTFDESVDERSFPEPATEQPGIDILLDDKSLFTNDKPDVDPEQGAAVIPVGTLRDLMDRIATNHHAHARRELSRLRTLAREVSHVYGMSRPELIRVAALVADIDAEMATHAAREENGLFQCIARMENAVERGIPLASATVDGLTKPVKTMMREHDTIADMMGKLHSITNGFHASQDASQKLKELYVSLADLERKLQQHALMEHNALFPRALALAAQLR